MTIQEFLKEHAGEDTRIFLEWQRFGNLIGEHMRLKDIVFVEDTPVPYCIYYSEHGLYSGKEEYTIVPYSHIAAIHIPKNTV